jgi:hypothetical protein
MQIPYSSLSLIAKVKLLRGVDIYKVEGNKTL